jgi:hypothetical protein
MYLKRMLRVISSKSESEELNRNEQRVHFAFRASNKDLSNLLQNCPRIRAIQGHRLLSQDALQGRRRCSW